MLKLQRAGRPQESTSLLSKGKKTGVVIKERNVGSRGRNGDGKLKERLMDVTTGAGANH